jgi:exodeoxyribonuclease V beta subunit
MESDEAAIKIVTIHKSKGLEYNIVMAPFLDMNVKMDESLLNFRNPDQEVYYFINKGLLSTDQEQWLMTDAEQENRRLLYVALTRAKYACFVNSNNSRNNNNSSLRRFVQALRSNEAAALQSGIASFDAPIPDADYIYDSGEPIYPISYEKAERFHLLQPFWRKMSYSFLNPEHTLPSLPYTVTYADPYDQFIFKELKKGAHTGNLLHFIFERIDFSDPTYWETVVRQALKRLSSGSDDSKVEHLLHLLETITQVNLISPNATEQQSIRLCEVKRDQRLNELEFDFVVNPFSTAALQHLAQQETGFALRNFSELEGIMNGKVDLFFEHQGKYYILDWKSNYLGDLLENYEFPQLQEAMNLNNYHLQYHIYTVALCKYLRLRLPNFDYETHFGGVFYLFLRGVRKEGQTGIYFNKPSAQLIQKMESILC